MVTVTYSRDSCGQGGFPVVNMADGSYVDVWLVSLVGAQGSADCQDASDTRE